jgi:hypothetical protein
MGKRYERLWPQVIERENLWLAFKKAARGMRLTLHARKRQRLWVGLWKMGNQKASEIALEGDSE